MIIKSIIVVHRYLGVVLGVIMTVWCLSGFVMMYQGFPNTSPEERAAGLERLDLSSCCADIAIEPDAPIMGGRIEMLNGAPVLRTSGRGGSKAYDLSTGAEVGELSEAGVRRVAEAYAAGNGIRGGIAELRPLRIDQWTAQVWRRAQPMWQAKFDDPGRTWVYINGAAGEVVQDASLKERWLSWFGAVPHWLYPTILRENQRLWTEVVIWSSAIGCFLVVTGIFLGFVKLRSKSGKWFPYKRPMWLWHHIFGTFAGILVLTWTFSGLLTMSPWALLESKGAVGFGDFMSASSWRDTRPLLEPARNMSRDADVVSIKVTPLFGASFLTAMERGGEQTRIGAAGPAPLQEPELRRALSGKGGVWSSAKVDTITVEDDYYYGHKREAEFPIYRITFGDPDSTRAYLDHTSGELRLLADATAKRYRWFESGLHSFDFAFMRSRPVWDIIVVILLAAVTISCATGAWLSFTRVGQDVSRLGALFRRKES